MPTITVGGATNDQTLTFTGNDALSFANAIAAQINTGEANGTLTPFNYTSGLVAPEPASGRGGVINFTQPTNGAVFVNGADQFIVDAANGPVSIQGGAVGGSFIAGAGLAGAPRNVTYTNITPSGAATDSIAVLGGNNLIQTATFGTGNYNVATGNGNDTINILMGNATINAGSGQNQINLGNGNNLIASEGFDTITGAPYGSSGGVDTVAIGSGQTSINSGGSSFLVQDFSPNALLVTLGSGVDTVQLAGSAGATVNGIYTTTTINPAATLIGTDTSTGDSITLSGSGSSTVTARGANDTISAAGSTGNNLLTAGTGNDTLVAGQGNDTLTGANGPGATAFLASGVGGSTTFSFSFGRSSGSDTISGFKATDVLAFNGTAAGSYGGNPLGTGTTGVVPGGTTYTLNDGTTLTILGATQPAPTQVRTS